LGAPCFIWRLRKLVTEADVHFELYRHLTNLISGQSQYGGVEFDRVEPERVTEHKAADLVLWSVQNGVPSPVVVIEVKKPGTRGVLVFDESAVKQAQRYAQSLGATLSIVTDGFYLRVFRKSGESLGDYRFVCDADACRRLLLGIVQLLTGESSSLRFERARSPSEEIMAGQTNKMTSDLLQLLHEVSGTSDCALNSHGNVNDLVIRGHKVLALQLNQGPAGDTLVLWLNGLRSAAGLSFGSAISNLSELPGFAWIKSRDIEEGTPFIFRSIRDIVAEDPVPIRILDGLRKWLFDLRNSKAFSPTSN
jgi:hypothetical protein